MIQIDDTIISLDIVEENFLCNLSACKGECCVDGDSGAPLEPEEVKLLEEALPHVWDSLSPQAQALIKEQGVAYKDRDGDMVTSIVNGKDCVFTYYDSDGTCKCAIEKAYREGRIGFYKPVSCHLYPIRLGKYREFTALNYHRWRVCKAAVELGNQKGLKIYQFLKEPLIRRFGQKWYDELCLVAEEYLNSKMKD
ncbi:hypothetical protein M2132_000360 [Dysgonomonas sp. PH5-45]|uniref:DUF3109 family protein n=1 Tax=unclassified Dysgonomonas TaxID=2630389 RepID=UPI0024762139|nr:MULTISPECIES: DUF3109 family protein [unclassified Dysgonomonas]MDH6354040.1 hypothetical protein [Dysgonomonas sp. PH5-45]MDH6386942.1 hypothetical protein [Dysgonomonas sp. PH5-37]